MPRALTRTIHLAQTKGEPMVTLDVQLDADAKMC
jgi:hypothetical protein